MKKRKTSKPKSENRRGKTQPYKKELKLKKSKAKIQQRKKN